MPWVNDDGTIREERPQSIPPRQDEEPINIKRRSRPKNELIMIHPNKILILGSEGFIGHALWNHLKQKGFEVLGVDNGMRRRNVALVGSRSLIHPGPISCTHFDITDYDKLKSTIEDFGPGTIIHLAEQPSAPFSMINAYQATYTQHNNVVGTLNVLYAIKEVNPDIHLIKLGTAGEYPDWLYKDVVVPESSRIKVKYEGKDWEIPTPRYAGSWYHFSKLYDSFNIDYACRIWGLKSSDLNQGIVYGHRNETRLDYDYYFGTVVHRFIAQALCGEQLTVYGSGGQTRGFIHLQNSLEAIELMIQNPPVKGEYRIIHQLTQTYTVNQIAQMVKDHTGCQITHLKNPRFEMDENTIKFEAKKLKDLGLKELPMEDEIKSLYNRLREKSAWTIAPRRDVIQPRTTWN